MKKPWTERTSIYAPPWMIIGISALLMGVVVVTGLLNYNREKATMGKILMEKGAALIRSFEAGARTGMMGLFGTEARLQTLMEQTASQPDLSYILLVDQHGEILAHNNRNKIGTTNPAFAFNDAFSPGDAPKWRTVKGPDNENIFEVYKRFLPLTPSGSHMNDMPMMGNGKGSGRRKASLWCSPDWMDKSSANRILDPENRPAIIIGMVATPLEEAMSEDLRTNIIILSLIFLLSVTGVVTLFRAQNLMKSRKLLKDTRAFASEIVANLPVGIVVVGDEGRILYINTVARRLLNIIDKPNRLVSATTILPKSILDLHAEINEQHPVAEREISLDMGAANPIPVTASVTDVINDDRQTLGFMVVLKDLSELRHLQKEIQRREKLAAVGNLAAGIAHEVRNPLSSIKGYAAFLGSQFDADSDQRRAAETMSEEVDRVNRVISELLEFARPSDLKQKPTKFRDLIDHCVKIVAHEAEFAGISIDTQVQTDMPAVLMDPDRMTQVLLNLLINAIQAMDKGGRLDVGARMSGSQVILDVSDTGPGIPDEDLAHVFNPYFTRKKNGTGLGLAIVVKIVENHGGSVGIQNRVGQGSIVTVSLPLHTEKDAS